MELTDMDVSKSKILKNPTSPEADFDCPNFTKEEMQKLRYGKDNSRNKRKLTTFEWKIRCFIHRVKRRIENFISYFSNCDEY